MKTLAPPRSLIDRDRPNAPSLAPVCPSPPDENHLVTGGERERGIPQGEQRKGAGKNYPSEDEDELLLVLSKEL